MLLVKCQELSRQIKDVSDLKKSASDLKKFQDREEKIQALVTELKPLVTALSAFRERVPEQLKLENRNVDLLLEETNQTLSQFRENRGWLVEDEGFKLKSLKSKVDSLKKTIDNLLRNAWNDYKKSKVRDNKDLLDTLGKIEKFRSTVVRIQRLHAQIEMVAFPRDKEHLKQIDQGIDEMSQAWNSLSSDEVPKSVLDFLRAASTHGASLDSLTLEVEEWLKDQAITRFFQIKLT